MEREDLSKLPTGWVETRLGNIVHPSDEKVEPSILQEVPYVGLEHIEKTTGKLLEFGNSSEVKSTKSKFYSGDLLYGKLRPYLNKVHCVNFEGVCSTDILVFPKQPYISNEFLSYRFLCKDFVSYASQNVNGVQHPRVNFQSLSKFPIALPPLNEQRRIVAKIEALKARSQRVKEALEAIPPLIYQFRQSVLAAAFRGDLTADWREKNPDVESASELLVRIQEEIPKRRNKRQVIELPDLFKLPNKWKWASLSNICRVITDGDHQVIPKVTQGIPLLDISNIRSGELDFSSVRYVSEEYYHSIPEYKKPAKDDLLYSVVGSYGIPALIKSDAKFSFQRNMALLKPCHSISASYFLYALKSGFAFKQATEVATGTSQPLVTLSGLSRIKIPITSLPEQRELVAKVEALLKAADQVEQQYQQAKAYLDQLDQSILAKAFRGELVPQHPNDEPASVLLERIRAERAKQDAAKTAKKSSAKTTGQRRKKAQQQHSESVQLDLPGLE